MTASEPQKEHQWLEQFVGDWNQESEAILGPGRPSQMLRGTERVRSIGGFWVQAEGCGETPGGCEASTQITLGYDPQKQRFVATYIASQMSRLWVYEGSLDATGKVLSLETEGPSFARDGKMTKYRDVIEVKSDDHRVMTSYATDDAGSWKHFMTTHYRRAIG